MLTVEQVLAGIQVNSVTGSAPPALKDLIIEEAAACGVAWANSSQSWKWERATKKEYASTLKKHIKRTAKFPKPSGFLFSTFILPFIINQIVSMIVAQIIKLIFSSSSDD